MKNIKSGEIHAIVVSRIQDGAVGFFYARDPLTWLAALGAHSQLDQTEVRPGRSAARAVNLLRARFAITHVPSEALPWFLIDFKQAVAALDGLDLESGEIVRDLAPDSDVIIFPSRSRGKVLGFTHGGAIAVRLTGVTGTHNVVITTRENVKPVLKARPVASPAE